MTDDFDESTPPPRVRPMGQPIPRRVVLPEGESVTGAFSHWDYEGRIPAWSVLAEFVGTGLDPKKSGYRVLMPSATGTKLHTELGRAGDVISPRKLDGYMVRAEVIQGRFVYVIFSPRPTEE